MIEEIRAEDMDAERKFYWQLGKMIPLIEEMCRIAGVRHRGKWFRRIQQRPHKVVDEMINAWTKAVDRIGDDLEPWMEGPFIGQPPESFDGRLHQRHVTSICAGMTSVMQHHEEFAGLDDGDQRVFTASDASDARD